MPRPEYDGGFAMLFLSFLLFISILNKLTPEKFDKLCLELLNVGVDSKLVLKGIILLVSVLILSAVLMCYPYSQLALK